MNPYGDFEIRDDAKLEVVENPVALALAKRGALPA